MTVFMMYSPSPIKVCSEAPPSFRDDKEIVALQAADMLAWHIHRYLERPDEERPVMAKISNDHEGRRVTKDGLGGYVTQSKWIDPKQLEESF